RQRLRARESRQVQVRHHHLRGELAQRLRDPRRGAGAPALHLQPALAQGVFGQFGIVRRIVDQQHPPGAPGRIADWRGRHASVLLRRLVEHGPEAAERAHRIEELVHVDRLDHIGVHAQVPAHRQVAFLARRRQHHDRQRLEAVVAAQVGQHFQPVHARHLDVEQQYRRVAFGAVGPLAAPVQVVQHFHPVLDVHDGVGQVRLAQRIDRHFGVVWAVLGQQDGAQFGHGVVSLWAGRSPASGSVKWKVAPLPGSPSAWIRPPWRASTRRTLARPMPVPGNSLGACRRWNTPNNFPAYFMSKPAPLSRTVKWWPSVPRRYSTSMRAGSLPWLYLTALPSRLSHTWRSMFSSPTTTGSGAIRHSMACPGASVALLASSIARVSDTSDCMSTVCTRSALRPRREYTSRSSISADMRRAEDTITSR